jgi:hypothetical protein
VIAAPTFITVTQRTVPLAHGTINPSGIVSYWPLADIAIIDVRFRGQTTMSIALMNVHFTRRGGPNLVLPAE